MGAGRRGSRTPRSPDGDGSSFHGPRLGRSDQFPARRRQWTGYRLVGVVDPHEVDREGSGNSQALRADAGDDQLGIVGRQVTLNGFKSEPRGQIGYRWVQTGGPTVRLKLEDGYIYSFVPTVPGLYRFALVVGSGSRISQPDEVCVTVGSGTRGIVSRNEATPAESLPTQEIARAGMLALRLGPDVGEPLARTFDDTADRMDLYETYADAFAEMSRRLESVLPAGAARRHSLERTALPASDRPGDRGHAARGSGSANRGGPLATTQRDPEGRPGRSVPSDGRGNPLCRRLPLSSK